MTKSQVLFMKAIITNLIIAFIYSLLIVILSYFLLSQPLSDFSLLLDLISANDSTKTLEEVSLDLTTKNLAVYPEYGSKYAELSIPSLNIKKDVYYGDSMRVLKKGIGHTMGSFFPGEGGSILYMGHNTSNMLRNLGNINLNDKIIVTTNYGTYTYSVYETKIIEDTDLNEVPIKRDKEILMLYTCYPFTTIVYTKYRFVVYATLDN